MASCRWRRCESAATADYERDIKPIFQQRCYECHSRLKQKGGLRLDAGALIHKGGKEGAVVVSRRPDESNLVQRILSTDESERMPPEGKRLLPDQIALLRQWISEGATYPKEERVPQTPAEHWSFQPVRAPHPPVIVDPSRARNPIRHLIQRLLLHSQMRRR